MLLENLMIRSGYEMPKNTSKEAISVFRRLRRDHVVIFNHDDGPDKLVRGELQKIAGMLGILYYEEPYRLVLIDNEPKFTYKGK
jgi:hypothetical protein